MSNSPGPGQYTTLDYIGKEGVKPHIGGRHNLSHTINSPGPGAYNGNKGESGPKYSIGYRPTNKLKADIPGPGNYDPDYHRTKP
jgi:hypothetical protein